MKTILIATQKPFAKIAVSQMKQIAEDKGYKVVLFEKYAEQSDFEKAVTDCDAIIIRSDLATKEVFDAAKNLKIIVRAGAGFDNIDLAAATAHNVVAMNTPGQNSNAVAELVFGMMISAARNGYDGKDGVELRGKKLGIHAYGNVGRYVAEIAKGFGMSVYAFDPFVAKEKMQAEGVTPVSSVEELYSTCQYVSLHIPATAQTKKSINFGLLNTMPQGAVLVNTARKEVIDEDGILKMMENRADFKYLSDIAPDCAHVFAEKYEGKYFFTPKKMGAQTAEANINAGIAAVNQIIDFFETGNVNFKVNK
ncbi:MAG TPA: 3-phosphoglycerate dehydrogenase [Marinilabiliales bacterium]|nr:MAG: 3-phosphoglycerate dehydrogenase [Bacteroidetes bacterium GWD2_40_43]OFX89815.1 MAG: 3-phosphoglycerate dehydrogenase [Bacteroidetes bacterium GWE2_40_63]OFY21992.1 MAG: 3-phosphoglycerate dehydrogenase [Bacteroidetes bacterium GWF2_40_13]OFZ26112.1 MAG: 3-phosphoglycerate dehydrogenase [Bacteroidetes bacterium RIFOXYC2_FULL_40_12]HAM97044.1 3-phosphoglycerate dehydrogenase [Marinilabiliales bacterium]